MQCYPIHVSEVKEMVRFIKTNEKLKSEVLQLVEKVEREFELPRLHLVTRTERTGRPIHYKGQNIPEIRRALFVYLFNELKVRPVDMEKWFGFDHSSYQKAVKKGNIFLEAKDGLFMVYYDFVCGLACSNGIKIAV